MTTPRALKTSLSQQALALSLAAVLTFGLLVGVVGVAGADPAAALAQPAQPSPQTAASMTVAPVA